MRKGQTWIGKAAFVSFLLVVFSLGSMKPTIDSPAGSLTPTDLLFPFSLITIIAAGLLTGRLRRWHRGFWMFILFLLTMGLAAVFSEDPSRSMLKFIGSAYLVLLAFVAFNCLTSIDRIRMTIIVWLVGAALPVAVAAVAVAVFYIAPGTGWLDEITYHYGAVPVGYFPRVNSTMVSPSMLCNYLTVTLVLVLTAHGMHWLKTRTAVALIAAITAASVFTFSITLGGLALAAGLWVSPGSSKGSRGVVIASWIIAAAFLAIAPVSMTEVLQGSLEPSSRVLVWSDAARTFLSDPILGKGPGLPVADVVFQNSDGTVSLLTDAHNIFLNVAAQSGIIGLFGILAVILAVLGAGLLGSSSNSFRPLRRGLLVAFACGFVYDGLTGSFEDTRHLWVLMGLIFAVDKMPVDDEAELNGA